MSSTECEPVFYGPHSPVICRVGFCNNEAEDQTRMCKTCKTRTCYDCSEMVPNPQETSSLYCNRCSPLNVLEAKKRVEKANEMVAQLSIPDNWWTVFCGSVDDYARRNNDSLTPMDLYVLLDHIVQFWSKQSTTLPSKFPFVRISIKQMQQMWNTDDAENPLPFWMDRRHSLSTYMTAFFPFMLNPWCCHFKITALFLDQYQYDQLEPPQHSCDDEWVNRFRVFQNYTSPIKETTGCLSDGKFIYIGHVDVEKLSSAFQIDHRGKVHKYIQNNCGEVEMSEEGRECARCTSLMSALRQK